MSTLKKVIRLTPEFNSINVFLTLTAFDIFLYYYIIVKLFTGVGMKKDVDKMIIPKPAIVRLSTLYVLLENLEQEGKQKIFSAEIGKLLGVPSHTIRKDISFLRQAGTGNGYEISTLKNIIAEHLGFNRYKKACIVGMGRLGTVITTKNGFYSNQYAVVAGFDNNEKKIKKGRSDMDLYPMDRLKEVIERENIKIGIITVPQDSARKVANDLIECGIKGIINFSPVLIEINREDVFIRNIFIAGEFNILSALISQYDKKQTLAWSDCNSNPAQPGNQGE